MSANSTGALAGVRVVELSGLGPASFGATLLSDLGADVVRIDRPPVADMPITMDGPLSRGRRSIALDLKKDGDRATARALIDGADVLIDPFRPGVTERLGLGPEDFLESNPRLIYARMTGWGQDGPLAQRAGHDLNYVALSGALAMMGTPGEPPPVPLNLIGDFGGGGMLLGFGIVAALYERDRSGIGQVLDVAMLDGVLMLAASLFPLRGAGMMHTERGRSFLDGGAPWYRAYRTGDGRYLTVGALEPQFYRQLLDALGIEVAEFPQWDTDRWPALTTRLEELFAGQPLAHWTDLLGERDVCFAPVLDLDELESHPHHAARGTVSSSFGTRQPAPVPRFSRTPARIQGPPVRAGQHTAEILAELDARHEETGTDESRESRYAGQ